MGDLSDLDYFIIGSLAITVIWLGVIDWAQRKMQ